MTDSALLINTVENMFHMENAGQNCKAPICNDETWKMVLRPLDIPDEGEPRVILA